MDDNWVFCAERQGQKFEEKISKLVPVSGTVLTQDKNPISDAVVRIGAKSTKSDANGRYQFDGLEIGKYNIAATKAGYEAYSKEVNIEDKDNKIDIILEEKSAIDLTQYDTIASNKMKVYIGKGFPIVARYQILENGVEVKNKYFRGNETNLNSIAINGVKIEPTMIAIENSEDSRVYSMDVKNTENNINLEMKVKISVKENDLTWEVIDIKKAEGSAKIKTIDVPGLNLLTIDAVEEGANFAGAKASTTTTVSGDSYIDFEHGFIP